MENINNIKTFDELLENVQKILKGLIAKLSGKEDNDNQLLDQLENMNWKYVCRYLFFKILNFSFKKDN